jgi:hypothetical protein
LQVGFLPLAAALAAGQIPSWVDAFLVDRRAALDHGGAAEQVGHALVFVVMLVAFALSVRASPRWMLLWPVAVAMLWVAVPFRIMTTQLAGQLRPSSGLPDTLPDILRGGLEVFRASFWAAPQPLWPWLLAALLAAGWLVAERRIGRSRR